MIYLFTEKTEFLIKGFKEFWSLASKQTNVKDFLNVKKT